MLNRIKKILGSKIEGDTLNFGDLDRLTPVSRKFGIDRGSRSVARYYIDQFIESHANDIQGHVLEIGDPQYTKKYGGNRVSESDVLNYASDNPNATIIADLTKANEIESNTFDCIILAQTLQFIYDFNSALYHTHRICKPGGVVLVTLSGISQISTYDMERWGEYWRFTSCSAKKLFENFFQNSKIQIKSFGNVFSATAFLYGFSADEIPSEKLDYSDEGYEVIIAIRAIKN